MEANKFVSSSNIKNRFFISLYAILGIVGDVAAQKYFSGRNEFGLLAGVSNYHGDLSHGLNIPQSRISGGVYFKHHWSSFFSNRFQLSYLNVAGTDASSDVYKFRNLTFQTSIYEVSNMLEFNFQPFGTNYNDEAFTPYFFTGLAAFIFDPRRLENEDIKLRPLKTEGQNRNYSRLQPSIPIGIGIKTISTPKKNKGAWIFGIEACWRKTFTDYLDDVKGEYPDYTVMVNDRGLAAAQYSHAQTLNGGAALPAGTMRGDTHLKDWYYFVGISLSYRITPLICRL